MACSGLETDVVVVGVVLGPLVVQRHIDIAFPDQVLDHRLGLHDLLDARQVHRLGCLAVGQGHFACLGSLERLGLLAGVGILLDQQLLVAFKGLHLFPVQGDRTAVRRFEQQLAAVEDLDLAAQAVAIFHPDSIGERRGDAAGGGEQ